MSQEIKQGYRAKDNQGNWVNGSCVFDDDDQAYIVLHQTATVRTSFECWRFIAVDNDTVCKITPYMDDFKKSIYLSDILRVVSNGRTILGEIVTYCNEWGLVLINTKHFISFKELKYDFIEIAGNTYDNQAMIRSYKEKWN